MGFVSKLSDRMSGRHRPSDDSHYGDSHHGPSRRSASDFLNSRESTRDSRRDSRDSYRDSRRDSRDSYRDSRDSYRDSRRDSRDSSRRHSKWLIPSRKNSGKVGRDLEKLISDLEKAGLENKLKKTEQENETLKKVVLLQHVAASRPQITVNAPVIVNNHAVGHFDPDYWHYDAFGNRVPGWYGL